MHYLVFFLAAVTKCDRMLFERTARSHLLRARTNSSLTMLLLAVALVLAVPSACGSCTCSNIQLVKASGSNAWEQCASSTATPCPLMHNSMGHLGHWWSGCAEQLCKEMPDELEIAGGIDFTVGGTGYRGFPNCPPGGGNLVLG